MKEMIVNSFEKVSIRYEKSLIFEIKENSRGTIRHKVFQEKKQEVFIHHNNLDIHVCSHEWFYQESQKMATEENDRDI